MALRILLVDPYIGTGQHVREHLRNYPVPITVFPVPDGRSAIEHTHFHPSNIIMTDILPPDAGGHDLIKRFNNEFPDVRILVYTARNSRESAREAFEAGASGYLFKKRSEPEIGSALQAVLAGKKYLSPLLSRGLSPEEFMRNVRAYP